MRPKRSAFLSIPTLGGGGAVTRADYRLIQCVSRFVMDLLSRCWMICAASVLLLFLCYWLYGGLGFLLLLCFGITGVLYRAGDYLLYHPEKPQHSRLYVPSPALFKLPYENIYFKTRDSVYLNAVLIKQPTEVMNSAVTLVYLHGNAGNIGHRMANARGLYRHSGCNIFMVEYRGYGLSEGSPSEEGLYMDAQAALDYIASRPDIDPNKLVLFGRSLGGAVAIDLATQPRYSNRIMAIIVENTFTSIPDIAHIICNVHLIKFIPLWCYKNKFLSKCKMSKIHVPILFLSGLLDGVVPPKMMQDLYDVCGSNMKRIVRFETGTHNDTWQCDGYYPTLNLFIDDVLVQHEVMDCVTDPTRPLLSEVV